MVLTLLSRSAGHALLSKLSQIDRSLFQLYRQAGAVPGNDFCTGTTPENYTALKVYAKRAGNKTFQVPKLPGICKIGTSHHKSRRNRWALSEGSSLNSTETSKVTHWSPVRTTESTCCISSYCKKNLDPPKFQT